MAACVRLVFRIWLLVILSDFVIRASSFYSMERVLIIEDELPMRTALQDVLAGEGYRVLTAPDGESGLRRAIEEKPDLILLDIMMPKLDGYAVCAELRRLSNPVPILMLTAKGQVEDRVTGSAPPALRSVAQQASRRGARAVLDALAGEHQGAPQQPMAD